jgi:pimeloyl-ACP methyl ester carboxylesterase
MKLYTLAFVLCCVIIGNVNAQFDDKFYAPKKEWNPINDTIDYKEISFTINDTDNISGILLEPQRPFKHNILFFHGAGGNVSTYLFMTAPLAELGYRVMMIDVRGYGKSDGIPTHVGIAADAPQIYDWVKQQEGFAGKKLIVYGASMGTQVAANLAKEKQDSISLLVLDGAMLSFTDIAVHSSPEAQKAMVGQFVGSPYSAKEDVKEIKIPVLIVHSQGDEDIPFEMGQQLYELANDPKLFWEYEGGHLEGAMKYPSEMTKKIEEAISKSGSNP